MMKLRKRLAGIVFKSSVSTAASDDNLGTVFSASTSTVHISDTTSETYRTASPASRNDDAENQLLLEALVESLRDQIRTMELEQASRTSELQDVRRELQESRATHEREVAELRENIQQWRVHSEHMAEDRARLRARVASLEVERDNIPTRGGRMVQTNRDGAEIEVPYFLDSMQTKPKECAFCADEVNDLDIGTPEQWIDVCDGFHGDWMWEILLFPEKLGLHCQHDIDFCTGCFQRHLESQLEQYGRSRCDRLACPGGGCGRVLAYDEIKLYAKPDTFDT